MISSSRPPRSYPQDFIEALRSWANSPKAEEDLEFVFGQEINWVSGYQFLAGLQVGDISKLPPLKILPGESMPSLWGGYSRDLRLVFLSADCPEELIVPVLLEEIGHFFDQEFCAEETPGDEGAVFSAMVLGGSADHLEVADDVLRELNFTGFSILVEAAPKVRGSAKTQGVAQPKVRGSIGSSPVSDFSTSQDGSVVYANKNSVKLVQAKPGQRVIGSKGNDTFVVVSKDVRLEDPNGGTDTIESKVSFSIAGFSFIENLTAASGTAALSLTGNAKANIITGNSGNNIIDGGLDIQKDILIGGAGNDTYVLRDTLDQIIEAAGGGTDTIVTTQSIFSMANYANVENLAYSGAGTGVSFTGNSGKNRINGTAGADSLDGGAGVDSLIGGAGNDTYFVDDSGDKIFENASAGIDLVVSTASSYTLGNNIENLSLQGTAATSGFGNLMDNVILGNIGDNSISGGSAGNDSIFSGGGADTVFGENGNDLIVGDALNLLEDAVGQEIEVTPYDPAKSDSNALALAQAALGSNSGLSITSAKFTGKTLAAGILKDGVNFGSIRGESIELGAGFVLSTGLADTKGKPASGNQSTINNTAGSYLVNDILKEVFSPTTTSRDGATLEFKFTVADPSANWITMKILFGSEEYPEYISSYPDIAGVFIDGVNSAFFNGDHKLPLAALKKNVDAGYFLDNSTGEYSTAYDGITRALTLSGQLGVGVNGEHTIRVVIADTNDAIIDSAIFVSDIKVVNSGTFGLNFSEPFGSDYLLGGDGNDTILGNAGNDTLLGGAGNDSLFGGVGNDTMVGGAGDDTLIIDSAGDLIVESPNQGLDTILTSISYNLSNSVRIEMMQLTGALSSSLGGNDFDNTLTGNSVSNTLSGAGGNDSLFGGGGMDTLIGGAGNDSYFYDGSDLIIENAGEGNADYVESAITYTLAANLEVLHLTGGDTVSGFGNAANNTIIGNAVGNNLNGGAGDDTILGGGGDDTLTGGEGNDSLFAESGNNSLVGGAGIDTLAGGSGNDTFVHDSLDASIAGGGGTDLVESAVTIDLTDGRFSGVENILLTGSGAINATGDASANRIEGNSGANRIDGGAGIDTLLGGAGNDTFVHDSLDASIAGGDGTDLVESATSINLTDGRFSGVENILLTGTRAINATGDASANTITGNLRANSLLGGEGNDTLDGGLGNDTMDGGLGDDFYVINTLSDSIIEMVNGGFDTISSPFSYTLGGASNLEALILTGSATNGIGNSQNNWIVGNSVNNSLAGEAGNDTLEGKGTLSGGTDTLNGGSGNDVYIVDSITDRIVEDSVPAGGTDMVRSSVSFDLSNILVGGGSAVENLAYTGSGAAKLAGNSLNNSLLGNDQNNTLEGKGGVDTLSGGSGSDVYIVDTATDWIVDAGGTADMVRSSVSFDLSNALVAGGNALENLTYTGINAAELTGNNLNNSIFGNDGGDLLIGKDGNDFLSGGEGSDYLIGFSLQEYSGSQIDTLTGGAGGDLFYLIDENNSLSYNQNGLNDYALITDFEIGVDKIYFGESEWSLKNLLPVGITNAQGLYNGLELIAVIRANGSLSSDDILIL